MRSLIQKLLFIKKEEIKIQTLKDIPGYNGDYKADILGNIWSFKTKKPRILKTWSGTTSPYQQVQLFMNNKVQKFLVHRLIAITFLDNPNNYPVVHHKDDNPLNNKLINLEWTTIQNNVHQTYKRLGATRNFKKVELYQNNQKIGEFNSKTEACVYASKLGASKTSLMKYCKTGVFELKTCND